MARLVLVLVLLGATVSCALNDVGFNNGSGRGVGFVWQGGFLRSCAPNAPQTASCSQCTPCPGTCPGLRKLRLPATVCHVAHGHSHGDAAHSHEACGHSHPHSDESDDAQQGTATKTETAAGSGKPQKHVLLVMDAAAEPKASASDAECGHEHGHSHGHSHEHSSSPTIGHTHEPSAAAATCDDADCGHDHGSGHSHSHSHSHGHAVAAAEECSDCGHDHGEGHSHSHQQAPSHTAGHSHSHSNSEVKSEGAPAAAAGSQTPEISSLEMIQKMFDSFLAGQGSLAAAGCTLVLLATKGVKVAVPFLYQYVLDTLGTGAIRAPTWVADVVAGVAGGNVATTAGALVLAYTVTKIIAQLLQSANDVVFSYAVQPSVRRAGRTTVLQLLNMPLSFHTESNTGALTRSMERGMRAVTAVLSRIVLHLFPQSVELVMVAAIIGLRAGPELAAVAVGTVVSYGAFTVAAVNLRTRYLERMNTADNEATSRLLDALLHYDVVTSYNRQEHEASRYESSISGYQRSQIKSQLALAGLNFGQKVIEALGSGYLLWTTALLVMAGSMSLGELLMINALLLQMMGPLDHLGANYMQLKQGLVDAREMFTILGKEASTSTGTVTREPSPPTELLPSLTPIPTTTPPPPRRSLAVADRRAIEVVFDNVHFGYGGKEVLRGFSLKVERGTTVAIVGESGCGKSTVMRLLTRALSPSTGRVLLDGQDVAEVDLDSVREAVALVPQDASLFNEDIAYNIAYGNADASPAAVAAAASSAQLDDVTEDMPLGLRTQVGERGRKLSGGQRQRVAIARALLKDAPILLCDEASSALDVYTEGRVLSSLRQARKGKTTIVIAHRLSTIIHADEIVVMERGKVAERGSHTDLLAQRGTRYAAMWAAQEREVSETGDVVKKRATAETDVEVASLEEVLTDGHDTCGCGHAH